MKIGIDIRNIGKKRTGDEVVFFNLTKNLAEIDRANEYHLFTDITDSAVLQYVAELLGIQNKKNFKLVSLKCPDRFFWNFWTLPKYLRRNPVDVYLTQYITPWFVPKSIKIATIIHDISFNFYAKYIKFSDLFFMKLLIPMSLRRANKIIGVSKFTRDEIIKYYNIHPHTKAAGFFGVFKNCFSEIKEKIFGVGVNPKKVDWIYNAVSDNFSAEISKERLEDVRKKYNLPEKFILYVGTLQPRKSLPTLIKAYAKIKDRIPELRLVLAGNRNGNNFDKNIDAAIREAGLTISAWTKSSHGDLVPIPDVFFPGFIDEEDKPAIFKLAYIFCFPSFYEGFGVPVVEAFASGVPAVISEIPPHKEVAGDASAYFKIGDLDDLAEKLYNISIDENLKNKLIASGKIRAEFFSWRKSAEKLLEILKN